ncbi:uncharacterized protein PHALS_11053 [Plasmopara halstedii]|uniref:Uncharacterized protein n=1 Tax=Plasmopara halstedii TaxID=4781 RepID=A0A0P1AIX1_PLAHL|nr:uncharacterized protein PHALS_11053 [Plasmopara halstedii]CEG40874.1 hypothetical protein PHALS_11053 [Plasmopara halstedii]|eukprot:XP_024577243.1 hypothetical protein PHALS_11053 [Plasmopara halstedii]
MCVLGDAVDNSGRSMMNKRGEERITLSGLFNYVVISSNDFAFLIKESDLRSLCLEANNDMTGNIEFFYK